MRGSKVRNTNKINIDVSFFQDIDCFMVCISDFWEWYHIHDSGVKLKNLQGFPKTQNNLNLSTKYSSKLMRVGSLHPNAMIMHEYEFAAVLS